MISKSISKALGLVLCLMPALVFAQRPRQISIRVVDEDAQSVEGAEVSARYLATIRQANKESRVPMELAKPQTTDSNGECKLQLQDVSWSLAVIQAHRPGIKTEDVERIGAALSKRPEIEAFERDMKDLVERYSVAHQVISPEMDDSQTLILKMKKTIKVTGRVQVDGKPLAKALVSVFSPPNEIDQLFPRSSPSSTDDEGNFSFYSIPGELNRARIVAERPKGKRVLELTGISAQPTPDGLRFEFKTNASDYIVK